VELITKTLFDDLQYFVKYQLPHKPCRDFIAEEIEKYDTPFTIDQAMTAWYEHDALHYLSQKPFTDEGEECIVYLEKKFNRGWLSFGPMYNKFLPREFDCSHITQELITETSELIIYLG
jgi:hypothetical protein